MKKDTHPKYFPECKVTFRGEVVMTVGATVPEMNVEIWSGSHPFFTGQKTFVDTLGRVERFQKKFAGKYFDAKKKSATKRQSREIQNTQQPLHSERLFFLHTTRAI